MALKPGGSNYGLSPAQEVRQHIQQRFGSSGNVVSTSEINSGLPPQLRNGLESLSGMSMDGVRVHYHSNRPAQLQAHAYAQGSDIHVAPELEQHLSHEAWHVIQQRSGRVTPVMQP